MQTRVEALRFCGQTAGRRRGSAGGRPRTSAARLQSRRRPTHVASGPLVGILDYSELELVSADYIGNPFSCILDAKSTNVVDKTLVKVSGWYDNEWGYSSRCVDLLRFMGARL